MERLLDIENYEQVNQLDIATKEFFEGKRFAMLKSPPAIFSRYWIDGMEYVVDPTTVFVGSNTNLTKKNLEKGVPDSGIFNSGNRLRTNGLRKVKDYLMEGKSKYSSHFSGCGILNPPNSYESTCASALEYIADIVGINNSDLIITCYNQDKDLIEFWTKNNIAIQPSDSNSRFRWKFGDQDGFGNELYTGRGICIETKSKEGLPLGDFASIEKIVNQQGEEIAVEFGLGYETTMARSQQINQLSYTHPLEYCAINSCMENIYATPEHTKLADCLNTILSMLDDVRYLPNQDFSQQNKSYSVFCRYRQALYFLIIETGLSVNDITSIIEQMRKIKFKHISSSDIMKLVLGITKYQQSFDQLKLAITEHITGNTEKSLLLTGAKNAKKSNTPLNVVDLALKMGIVCFEMTKFYDAIKSDLRQDKNIHF